MAYWDGSKIETCTLENYSTSLGTAIGVVVVPKGFAPDGKIRIVALNVIEDYSTWSSTSEDTVLQNYTELPITDNVDKFASSTNYVGKLPSDKFNYSTSKLSFVDNKAKYYDKYSHIPSPYFGNKPNPEYYKELLVNGVNQNVLSDFNGIYNTQHLVNIGTNYISANACWSHKDGVSNAQYYLPAMGELGYMLSRFTVIQESLEVLNGVKLNSSTKYWSSTECDSSSVYVLGTSNGQIESYNKSYNATIRPWAIID